MWRFFFLIINGLITCSLSSTAQVAGRIYFLDSSILEVKEFTTLRTELYYYRNRNNTRNKKESSTIDFMREYSPKNIREITLKYEKGRGTDSFYYLLLVEGVSTDGSAFKRKIKTWDWLEMKTHNPGSGKNTEIIFFTEKKKLDIVKIEFE